MSTYNEVRLRTHIRAFRGPFGAAALLAGTALLGACQTITVPARDPTGPYLFVTLPDAGRLGASYAPQVQGGDSEPLGPADNIDPSRQLYIRPADADDPIRLHFLAFDHDSGIRAGDARVIVHFACETNENLEQDPPLRRSGLTADYYRTFGRVAAPGTTTEVSATTTIAFTLRQLWHEAHCPATITRQGLILGLQLTYYAKADNNNPPGSVLSTFRYNNNVGIRQTYLRYPAGG